MLTLLHLYSPDFPFQQGFGTWILGYSLEPPKRPAARAFSHCLVLISMTFSILLAAPAAAETVVAPRAAVAMMLLNFMVQVDVGLG